MCCNIVTTYYVNNTTHINQQLLKVKVLVTCFSYNESSGQKRNIVMVHSVIVHSMGSHIGSYRVHSH